MTLSSPRVRWAPAARRCTSSGGSFVVHRSLSLPLMGTSGFWHGLGGDRPPQIPRGLGETHGVHFRRSLSFDRFSCDGGEMVTLFAEAQPLQALLLGLKSTKSLEKVCNGPRGWEPVDIGIVDGRTIYRRQKVDCDHSVSNAGGTSARNVSKIGFHTYARNYFKGWKIEIFRPTCAKNFF